MKIFLKFNILFVTFHADIHVFPSSDDQPSGRQKTHRVAIAFGLSLGCLCLIVVCFGMFLLWRHKHNQQAFFDVKGKRKKITILSIPY